MTSKASQKKIPVIININDILLFITVTDGSILSAIENEFTVQPQNIGEWKEKTVSEGDTEAEFVAEIPKLILDDGATLQFSVQRRGDRLTIRNDARVESLTTEDPDPENNQVFKETSFPEIL